MVFNCFRTHPRFIETTKLHFWSNLLCLLQSKIANFFLLNRVQKITVHLGESPEKESHVFWKFNVRTLTNEISNVK